MKKILRILLVCIIIGILLLTFQNAEGTVRLSEGLRLWLDRLGFHMSFHTIRSNAHFVLYFIFGLILSMYGLQAGWNRKKILLTGIIFGMFDEGIKVFLPTREFDILDLLRDWIGVGFALVIVIFLSRNHNKDHNSKETDVV